MESKLIFVIGSPRSGSTLLQRMLSSHSAIFSCPEPHIITPLAHLGYYETVEKAPYDHLRAVDAIRGFVEELPKKEEDYLAACRAYTDALYSRRLETSNKSLFLDKTPAYALVLPFLAKLYPKARYIVLTRHPIAIFTSYTSSFFDGDYKAAHQFNPILDRYVPAMARFLKNRPVPLIHVRYEQLVTNPQKEVNKILSFLELPFEENVIEYGRQEHEQKGLGDPVSVNRHSRPMTKSVEKWAVELVQDEKKSTFIKGLIDSLDPEDLKLWGYPHDTIYQPLGDTLPSGSKEKKPPLDRFQLERKFLRMARRNIHNNTFGKLVKKIRFFCDVLLR
jgi:hypothetical protein